MGNGSRRATAFSLGQKIIGIKIFALERYKKITLLKRSRISMNTLNVRLPVAHQCSRKLPGSDPIVRLLQSHHAAPPVRRASSAACACSRSEKGRCMPPMS